MKTGHSRLWPDLSLVFSATMWGLLWYPLRLFEQAGMPTIWVTLIAFSTALAIGIIYTLRRWKAYLLNPVQLLLIAITAGWCNVSFLVALEDGNVIRVILLFYLSPIWTIVLGYYFLGEKVSWGALRIFLLAIIGAVVMLWSPEVGYPWPQNSSDWLALSSGFTFALSNILIRNLQQVSIPVKTTSSWFGGAIIALVWITLSAEPMPIVSTITWVSAVTLGVMGILLMTLAVQYGITHMPVYRSAIILLFEIVVTTVSAYLLIGETMSPHEWVGGSLVIISAWLIARREEKHDR